MNVDGKHYRTIWVAETDQKVIEIIDQRKLPHRFEILALKTVEDCATAIRDMYLRGAGAIGAAAGYGMYLATLQAAGKSFEEDLDRYARLLLSTRPTAKNLEWAVNCMLADARGDTLRIFNGIDPELQKDISFKGIYAGCSLIVSARMCSRRLENLEITSLHPMERTVRCIFRDGAEARRLLLSPGLNICDLSAWGDTQ